MKPEHLIGCGVALALTALALADGGYGPEVRAALAVVVWAAVLSGLLFGSLPRGGIGRAALVAGGLLALLILLAGASVSWGSDDGLAFSESVRLVGYLGIFTLVVSLSGPEGARPWIVGLAAALLAVATIAVLSRLLPALPGGDEEIARFLPAAAGRLSHPIGYWNALAAMLAMGSVAFAWLGASERTLARRSLSVAVLPVFGLGLYLTSSRGGFTALAAGIVILLGLGEKRPALLGGVALGAAGSGVAILLAARNAELLDGVDNAAARGQGAEVLAALLVALFVVGAARAMLDAPLSRISVSRRTGRAVTAAAAAAATIALALSGPGELVEEFKQVSEESGATGSGFISSHLTSGSGSGRYQFWEEALDAFSDQPLHGIGAGGYEAYWAEHATIARAVRDAHSLYLEVLAELGPLGLLALLGFLASAPVAAAGSGAQGRGVSPEAAAGISLLGTGATSAAVEWTWEITAAFAPVVLLVAVLTGPALRRVPRAQPAGTVQRTRRLGWTLAVCVVGWVALIAAADSFLTERSVTQSRSAAADGDFERAADRARDAIALQPFAAAPRLQLALVEEAAGELGEASESVSAATDRAPRDWRAWLARARIETRSGDVTAGRTALRTAQRLNPRNPVFEPLGLPPSGGRRDPGQDGG